MKYWFHSKKTYSARSWIQIKRKELKYLKEIVSNFLLNKKNQVIDMFIAIIGLGWLQLWSKEFSLLELLLTTFLERPLMENTVKSSKALNGSFHPLSCIINAIIGCSFSKQSINEGRKLSRPIVGGGARAARGERFPAAAGDWPPASTN